MTLTEFAHVFAPLAIQLRQTDADEATIRCYYEAMKDLEIEFVTMAAVRLAKEADWFPKTSEWRAMAVTVERERVEAHRALVRGCARCGGSGWIAVGPGVTDGGHLAPERVQACECTKLRRLEILGRRPWPVVPDDRQLVAGGDVVDPAETAALMTQIESRTGLTIRPRSMPDTTPATDELRAVKNVLAAAVVQLKADKAAKQVLAKIVESMRRCEELERQVPDAEEVSNG